jgi:magnesium chelatase subunit I
MPRPRAYHQPATTTAARRAPNGRSSTRDTRRPRLLNSPRNRLQAQVSAVQEIRAQPRFVVMNAAATSRPTSGPTARTLGELRETGHVFRPIKAELRANLLARLAAGEPRFAGIVGFDDTVLPQLERALLAGHDMVLLGERGQGKTRLARTLVSLLDPWTPYITGSELREHPYAPISVHSHRLVTELGDELPISWAAADERYAEKLATPDTSIGDLIGDVDPVKVAAGRSLGDPQTVHYGLVPRANRGIFVVNELPDLAERIQVGLLNVLEERDVQIRGYALRLPLDLLVVATANPEDYTNRGRIITPLKDRFGAEIRTHYPVELSDELALVRQEADWTLLEADASELPKHLLEVLVRLTRAVRNSPVVDSRSGVSARFTIAAAETVVASAQRRAALTGETAVARVADLPCIVPTLRGKVEFEAGEEGRELDVLAHLLRKAIHEVFRARLGGADLAGFIERIATGEPVASGDLTPAADLLAALGPVPGLGKLMSRLGIGEAESPGHAAAAAEFALEGLYLGRKISKQTDAGRTTYSAA